MLFHSNVYQAHLHSLGVTQPLFPRWRMCPCGLLADCTLELFLLGLCVQADSCISGQLCAWFGAALQWCDWLVLAIVFDYRLCFLFVQYVIFLLKKQAAQETATICPLWPWPSDLESCVRVTCDTSLLILVFEGLSVLNLGPMYTTSQTSDHIIA